jgi:mutator protein MutT
VNGTNPKKHIHVACALIERDGLVLAAQRSAAMNLPLKWEFPGGKLEAGESAQECLQRELVEEMSVTIAVGCPLPLHTHSYDTFTVTLYPFVCALESETITLHEHAAMIWLPPEELHTLDWAEADRPVLESYAKMLSDFPPPFQGEGRGGDGFDSYIPCNNQPHTHPHTHPPPNLPLERGGIKSSRSAFAEEWGVGCLSAFPLFDSHFHIIDHRFPLTPNNGYLPDDLTCKDYLAQLSNYDLRGGAIVSGSFQAFDQSYLLDALHTLGPLFVGVTQLPTTVSDQEILDLDGAGVRAVRFNLKRGGSADVRHLDTMARRVHELAGWHVELYVDSRELEGLFETLVSLPSVSIDHLGLAKEGFGTLLKLAERGVRVKATGFGRVDFEVSSALRELYAANPQALMFGTDLPSTRAPRPYLDRDFLLVAETLGEEAVRAVFYDNAAEFYRVKL